MNLETGNKMTKNDTNGGNIADFHIYAETTNERNLLDAAGSSLSFRRTSLVDRDRLQRMKNERAISRISRLI